MIEIKDIKDHPERLKIYTLHSYYDAGYTKGVADTKKRYRKARAEIAEQRQEVHAEAFEGEYKNLFAGGVHSGLTTALQIVDKYMEGEE